VATLVRFDGDVRLCGSAGNTISLVAQARLPTDAEVKTETGCAELLLANGGTVWANRQTRLVLESRTGVRVAKGGILVEMPPQGQGFCVTTTHGTATVTGTRFEVDVGEDTTRVSVLRGSVECRNGQGVQTVTSGKASEFSSRDAPAAPAAWTQGEPGLWACALQPAGANEVLNGGAEDLDKDGLPRHWSLYLGDFPLPAWGAQAGVSHSGSRCAFLTVNKPNADFFYCCGLIAGQCDGYSGENAYRVQPDSVYRISAWIRGSGFTRRIALEGWGFDEKGGSRNRTLGSTLLLPGEKWTRHEVFVKTSPTTRRLVPVIFIYGRKDEGIVPGATVQVDDVELRRVGKRSD
jgi:hypothetical protein